MQQAVLLVLVRVTLLQQQQQQRQIVLEKLVQQRTVWGYGIGYYEDVFPGESCAGEVGFTTFSKGTFVCSLYVNNRIPSSLELPSTVQYQVVDSVAVTLRFPYISRDNYHVRSMRCER